MIEHEMPEPLEIRANPVSALAWGLGGVVLVALAVWLAVVSEDPMALAGLVVFVPTGVWFIAQVVMPARFAARLDDRGVHLRMPWRSSARLIAWEEIRLVRIEKLGGDPFLEVQLGAGLGDRAYGMVLPVGADVPAVHDWLNRFYAGRDG